MSTTSVPSLVPPDPETYSSNLSNSLTLINNILSIQSQAIDHLSQSYKFSNWAILQLKDSLRIMNDCLMSQNKIIITGIGKSFKIASKIVATLNSLSLQSTILHPSDALHGDLGIIRDGDVLIMISASGSSSELVHLLTHLDQTKIKILLLTSNPNSVLSGHDKISSLIYAELPSRFQEENVYGLTAPTISTTLLLTLMDSVSIALSQLYISDLALRKKLFGERHPGGAIGQSYSNSVSSSSHTYSSSSEETSLLDFNIQNIQINQDYETRSKEQQQIDLKLVELIHNDKANKKIKYIDEFPADKSTLFEIAVLNDVVIYKETKAIETSEMIELIRQSDFKDIDELQWRILANFKPIRI